MAFQGSLKELPLPDIVQLVSASGKTGRFSLTREGAEGSIYLKNGQIVHAELGEQQGEEAIFALAIWNSGDFMFTPGVEAPRPTITKSNTNLLMEAARRIDEWRVLSKKIPAIDMVPCLQPRSGRHEQITLNPQEWLLITRINGTQSIAEIARGMDLSSFDVAKVLYGLITAELVNTALERLVDIASNNEFHRVARDAKDTAAAAVLCSAIVAAIIGLLVFVPRILSLLA